MEVSGLSPYLHDKISVWVRTVVNERCERALVYQTFDHICGLVWQIHMETVVAV